MAFAVGEILDKKAYTEVVINDILRQGSFDPKDKALINSVVNETVRMKRAIDHAISIYSNIPVEKIDRFALPVLRSACAQLLYFDRLPAFAVVDEAVKLVKKRRKYLTGYVNAVLRRVADGKDKITYPDIYTALSFESWMAKRWEKAFGEEFAHEYMRGCNKDPGTSLRVNTLKTDRERVKSFLLGKGYVIEASYPQTGVFVIKKAGGIADSAEYANGGIVFQDEAAARVCMFLMPDKNDLVLDMCAAPGGKTFMLSGLMGNSGRIIARDISENKITHMRAESARLGASNIVFETADACETNPEDIMRYDKVLADVPCTGTGIITKKPEIRWNRKEDDIMELARIQAGMLRNAFRYLKEGGELVYSTCSIEKEENEDIIDLFINEEPDASIVRYKEDCRYMKLFPHIDGTDAFFAAKLRKRRRL